MFFLIISLLIIIDFVCYGQLDLENLEDGESAISSMITSSTSEISIIAENETEITTEKIEEAQNSAKEPPTVIEPNVTESNNEIPTLTTESTDEPATVIEPNDEPDTVIEPTDEPDTVIEPIDEPATVIEPIDGPATVIEPTDEPDTVIEPNDEPDTVIEPTDEPSTVIEPNDEPATVIDPSANEETTVIEPSTVIKPTDEAATIIEPSATENTNEAITVPLTESAEVIATVTMESTDEAPTIFLSSTAESTTNETHENTASISKVSSTLMPSPSHQKCNSDNEELRYCTFCEGTCRLPFQFCGVNCQFPPRCNCKPGLLRHERSGACILPEECPHVCCADAGFNCIECADGQGCVHHAGWPKCVPDEQIVCNLECPEGSKCQVRNGHPRCINENGKVIVADQTSTTTVEL